MKHRRTSTLIALLVLGILPFTASAELAMVPVHDAPVAPGFELPGADGNRHSLDDYRGGFVLVTFWADWCAPCRREMASLQRLHEQLDGEGLTVVAIHAGPPGDQAAEIIRLNDLRFPLLVDESLQLREWEVNRLPTSILIDQRGRMIYRVTSPRAWESPAMVDFLRRQMERRGS